MNGSGYVSRITSFFAQPFSSSMNFGGWFLFTGLIIILAVLWTKVLRHVVEV